MPTTQFSRISTSTAAKAAGVRRHGMVGDAVVDADHRGAARAGLAQVEAAGLAVGVVAQVDHDPAASASISTAILSGMPSGTPGNGSWQVLDDRAAAGQAPDRLAHARLGVVEPLLGVLRRGRPSRPRGRAPAARARRCARRRARPDSRPTTARARGSGSCTCGRCRRRRGSRAAPGRPGRSARPPRRRRGRGRRRSSARSCRSRPDAPCTAARSGGRPSSSITRHDDALIGRDASCRGRASCAGRRRRAAASGWDAMIERHIRSGPIMMWIGRLSAAVSSRQSAVRIAQEKSCAGIEHARARGAEQRVRHLAGDGVQPVGEHRHAHAITCPPAGFRSLVRMHRPLSAHAWTAPTGPGAARCHPTSATSSVPRSSTTTP